MFHDLSRQLRRLMKETNVIRFKNLSDVGSAQAPPGWRNSLLISRGARMHATSFERGDGCAIAILDHRGVVRAWHDSLPDATTFDCTIIGTHVSQFYLAQDVALLRPDRGLIAACLHGSNTQQGWHRRAGGSIFWGVTVIEPIRLESGELYGYSHVTRFTQDPRCRVVADVRPVRPHFSAFHGAVAAA